LGPGERPIVTFRIALDLNTHPMSETSAVNSRLTAAVKIEFPDFSRLPDRAREKFERLPTKVNFFRMLGHSPGAFVEIIDLTNAIFKNLKISDLRKELLVLLVASHEGITMSVPWFAQSADRMRAMRAAHALQGRLHEGERSACVG